MTQHYDDLETRSPEQRAEALARALPEQIARAQALTGYGGSLDALDPRQITSAADLRENPDVK